MKRKWILIYWFLFRKRSYRLYKFHQGIKRDLKDKRIQHERIREVSQLFKIITIKLEQEFINWR